MGRDPRRIVCNAELEQRPAGLMWRQRFNDDRAKSVRTEAIGAGYSLADI